MLESNFEAVGSNFLESSLREAQDKAWKALSETAARIRPGHTEKDALAILKEILSAFGVEKIWHPPQIRFGKNTTLAFGEKGELATLNENDLFFLDIGPVFSGHEGDVGRTYTVGTDEDHARIARDAEEVFHLTRKKCASENLTGQLLYDYATELASARGWKLGFGGASGHRVSDFPHAVHYRGKLRTQSFKPKANRWILEIHLHDPAGRFGAFYEDLL
jgi:Xaa-Pro aminopeptidase